MREREDKRLKKLTSMTSASEHDDNFYAGFDDPQMVKRCKDYQMR